MKAALLALAAVAAALLGLPTAKAQLAAPLTYVQAGRLLADPDDGRVLSAQTVVVQDGRVLRIEPGYTSAPGAEVVDLRDSFVLPGLIDSHVHLLSQSGPQSRMREVTLSAADQAMFGAYNARKTLE